MVRISTLGCFNLCGSEDVQWCCTAFAIFSHDSLAFLPFSCGVLGDNVCCVSSEVLSLSFLFFPSVTAFVAYPQRVARAFHGGVLSAARVMQECVAVEAVVVHAFV